MKAYGCSFSRYETQQAARLLAAMGYDVYLQGVCSDRDLIAGSTEKNWLCRADGVILNTCTLTDYQEKNIIRPAIRRVRALNSHARLFLAGCCLRNKHSIFRETADVGLLEWGNLAKVFGQSGQPRAGEVFSDAAPVVLVRRTCPNDCSYCVCGMKKKREKQRPYQEIRAEINRLSKDCCFAGPCYGSWRDSKAKKKFSDLLSAAFRKGLKVRGLELHPKDLDGDVLGLLDAHRPLVEELSVPVQHASGHLLRKMNRGYGPLDLDDVFDRLDMLEGVPVTTDVIIGFPGETEKDLKDLFDFIRRHRLHRIDCYSFSLRAGNSLQRYLPCQQPAAVRRKVAWLKDNVVRLIGAGGFNDTTKRR